MSIRGFIKGTDKFPIQKCEIFRKFKEIGGIARRQTVLYATQAIPQTCHAQGVIDAEIAGKGLLWTETSYWPELARYRRSQTERTAPMITRHEPLFNLWRSLKDKVIF